MQTDTITYIIISGILALVLALFQYIFKSKKTTKIYWFLAFLRFISIFSVLLLLINPKFDKQSFYDEKPNLIVAVDNSESINYLNQSQNASDLIKTLKQNEQLNDNFNLEFYTFGKSVTPSDSLAFNEKQSNIAEVFDRLSEVYNNSVSPTLLITDGNQTYGYDYEFMTKRYKQPYFL